MTDVAQELRLRFEIRGSIQRLFAEWQEHLEIMLDGPVGVAKTMPISYFIHKICLEFPGVRWLIFRKTRVSLNNSFLKSYRDILTDPRVYLLAQFGEDPPEWAMSDARAFLDKEYGYLLNRKWGSALDEIEYAVPEGYHGPGSKLIFAGMDNPTRLRSAEYDAAFCNEGNELTLEEYESIRRSLRNRVLPAHPFIIDCNPGPPNHYLLRRVKDGRTTRMPCVYDDNPWITRTKAGAQYKRDVKASYTGHRLRRMYYGEWCGAEGMIWPEYQEDVHILRGYLEKVDGGWWLVVTKGLEAGPNVVARGTAENPEDPDSGPLRIRMRRFFASQDWGFVNPGVQQVWGMDDDGRVFMVREHYMTGKLIDWWAEVAVANYKEFECHPILCDPSQPGNIEAFNDRLGTPGGRELARIAVPADNAVAAGLDHVRDRMEGEPTIFFLDNALAHTPDVELTGVGDGAATDSRRPHKTVDEIPAYVYKDVEEGKEDKELPKKVDDHGCDAVRYACAWAWGKGVPTDHLPAKFEDDTYGATLSSWKKRGRKKRH